jgi:hypothetical protein
LNPGRMFGTVPWSIVGRPVNFRLTFPHYRMSSLREIVGASRSICGPYAD